MAAYIFDLDGTILKFHTNQLLPGAEAMLKRLDEQGHRIIFITLRDDERDWGKEWSMENTRAVLKSLGLKQEWILIPNLPVPRILIDDMEPRAVQVEVNPDWTEAKMLGEL